MIEFDPQIGTGTVRAIKDASSPSALIFEATSGKKYAWVAELKFEQAQRIVNDYASIVARVGLDDYEWLHLLNHHSG